MTGETRAAVIINPTAGASARAADPRARAAVVARAAERAGVSAEVLVTERAGHASDLARAASASGVSVVVAWGGDGTVNEVASALAFSETPIGIVPAGSGNGLARELKLPMKASEALGIAFQGHEASIDAGELDGRLFFNVAGVGLDAEVAHRFATPGHRRGWLGYVTATCQELRGFVPLDLTVESNGHSHQVRPLLLAIANIRQYGNGAVIAPRARPDDGELDVVAIANRSLWAIALGAPALFLGRINGLPGVTTWRASECVLSAPGPIRFHVDGEPGVASRELRARVRPGAIRVRRP
jgi:YegS/Rv2252/BmrU family lipid kinase